MNTATVITDAKKKIKTLNRKLPKLSGHKQKTVRYHLERIDLLVKLHARRDRLAPKRTKDNDIIFKDEFNVIHEEIKEYIRTAKEYEDLKGTL